MKNYKAYPAYKESSAEWIGKIPSDWDNLRLKYVFKEINDQTGKATDDLLSVSQYKGVTKKRDGQEEGELLTNAATLDGYKKVSKNDLVINIMLAWNGSLGMSNYNGITSPAYSIYRLKGEDNIRYFHYLLRTELFKAEFKRNSTGVIESRLRLYSDDFFAISTIIPPLPEQTAIANFLDKKTTQIKQFIVLKEKTIALLKERKTAIINQAVTKGLDLNVKMKDSGIEWLGEIPEHWEVKKFSHGIRLRHGFQFRDYDFRTEGIKVIKITQLSPKGYLDFSKATFVDRGRLSKFKSIQIKEGDILMALTGGTIGKIIRAENIREPLLQNYRVGAFYPIKSDLSMDMLFWILSSESFLSQIFKDQSETGQPNIGKEDLGKMYYVAAPVNEQKDIVAHILNKKNEIDQSISQAEKEIALMKEYQQSLISEAVTGKIDVREEVLVS